MRVGPGRSHGSVLGPRHVGLARLKPGPDAGAKRLYGRAAKGHETSMKANAKPSTGVWCLAMFSLWAAGGGQMAIG